MVARAAATVPVPGPSAARNAPPGGLAPPPRAAIDGPPDPTIPPADGAPEPGDGASNAVGARLRRQLRQRRPLRLAILALVSVVLLGAIPLFVGLRAASQDPVFDSLDGLDLPGWAAVQPVDDVSGSRWCLLDCRLRERTVSSQREPGETRQAYERALAADGWQPWKVSRCPEQRVSGSYTCWRRDELTLDLWVRDPTCATPAVTGDPAVPPATAPAATDCSGSLVSVKVRNAIDDERTRPQPSTDPSLTGEDPYPVLSDNPLGDLPTPSPS